MADDDLKPPASPPDDAAPVDSAAAGEPTLSPEELDALAAQVHAEVEREESTPAAPPNVEEAAEAIVAAQADTSATAEAQPPTKAAAPAPPSSALDANLIDQAELDALVAQLDRDEAKGRAPAESGAAPAAGLSEADLEAEMTAAIAAEMQVSQQASQPAEPGHAPQGVPGGAQPALIGSPIHGLSPEAGQPVALPSLAPAESVDALAQLDLLDDVELDVKIELGRTEMFIEDVLRLGQGSVIELDKLAGDPVDIYVNERLVARGEVLVLNESFCVRINDIVSSTGGDDDGK